MPFEYDYNTGGWREYTQGEGQDKQLGGLYTELEADNRLGDAAERRSLGLTSTILGSTTYISPSILVRANDIANRLMSGNGAVNPNQVDPMYQQGSARVNQLGAAALNPMGTITPRPVATAPSLPGVGPVAPPMAPSSTPQVGQAVNAPATGTPAAYSVGNGQYAIPDIETLTQRARTLIAPQYTARRTTLEQQLPAAAESAATQRSAIEQAYANAQSGFQLEAANLADTVTGNMGRSGLFGSGIHQQDLIDKAVKYGLPQRLAAMQQEKAAGLSAVDRQLAINQQNANLGISNLQEEQAQALAAEIVKQMQIERDNITKQQELGVRMRDQDITRLNQEEAGKRWAAEQKLDWTKFDAQQKQQAIENGLAEKRIAASNQPSTPKRTPLQEYEDTIIYKIQNGGTLDENMQAYAVKKGWLRDPNPTSTGVTPTTLFNQAMENIKARGIYEDAPTYDADVNAEYQRLLKAYGKVGNAPSTTPTATPQPAPDANMGGYGTPDPNDEIEELRRRGKIK